MLSVNQEITGKNGPDYRRLLFGRQTADL